jgi:predicted MFS family arabinose efflux permease
MPTPSARMTAFAGLAALAVAMGIGRFAFTPILPMMQAESGLSVAGGAWLASANYLGYLAGALSAIRMRMQPALAIRAGLVAIGVSTLAMGVEQPFLLSAVLRAIAGIASAWVLVFVSAWALERLALLGRPGLGGTVYAGVGAGIVIAGGTCLIVMSVQGRSTEAWFALGAVSLVIAAAIWPVLPSSLQGPAPAAVQPMRWRAEHWSLVLCYGAYGFGYIIPATFLPAMAKATVQDPQLFGWAWPLFGAAAVLSTILAAQLERFLSHRAVWAGSHIIMAVGVVIPLFVPGLPGIMLAALFVGGTFVVITLAGMQEARKVLGQNARALMAAMTAAFALGQILGPLVVSVLVRSEGAFAPALVVAAATLVVSVLLLHRRETVHA